MSDLISKQDVKWQIQEWINELNEAIDMLDSIPSAEPKTGEWVDDCTCSICHWMHEDNNGFALITKYNYCPNCGADMREPKLQYGDTDTLQGGLMSAT